MDINCLLENIIVPENSCEYWDVRIEEDYKTAIKYEDFELLPCEKKSSLGGFIRVYQNGMWYYSSTTELETLSDQVVQLCKQASKYKKTNFNSAYRPYNTCSSTENLIRSQHVRLDQIKISAKKDLCESFFSLLKSYDKLKGIKIGFSDQYKVKYFRSSSNVKFSYDFNQCGISISYSVIDGDNRFDDKAIFYGKDFESLKRKCVNVKEIIEESHLFHDAKMISAGDYPVVMDSLVVGVFAHESFGHKSEADFMLGDDEAKNTWKIGKKVGNSCLSIVDYGAEHGTSGYCPFDDEGFPAQKTYLIKNGILSGRLHSQQTSQILDEAPTGNGRAINFEFEPIVRMTNTYVEPGELTFNEMISKIKIGVYAKDVNHGSGLSTFTIAPRKCYMIRDGKIAEPIRVSVMSGSVFLALNMIEGCTKDFQLESMAFGGCGKMEQWPLPVGFGGSKVLISKLVVS